MPRKLLSFGELSLATNFATWVLSAAVIEAIGGAPGVVYCNPAP
jgi:hypothetical protein